MLTASEVTRYKSAKDVVLKAAFAIDDLPDNPQTWTPEQVDIFAAAALTLGAPESKLRRMARKLRP